MVKLRPEEISSVIRKQIQQYTVKLEMSDVGTVIQVADGVARIYGLENAHRRGDMNDMPRDHLRGQRQC